MELSKAYDPKSVENRLQAWWETNGYYKPEAQLYVNPDEKPFVITIPPPNVTGTLHMGHALTLAIEDLMTRYHRMKGARTLYVPGTDHAGIATQSVVEKNLAKQGRKRSDMSRSDFIEEVWDWKEHSHEIIVGQSKAMGISADWSREAFTMDEARSTAVATAFKMLYDRGLIYRDTRMVNWDPVQLTGVSDLEAETDEEGEPGHLWTVRYPLQTNRWDGPTNAWGSGKWAEGATEFITVATTRPETILGDCAVMVNPGDDRYTPLIGCTAVIPAVDREVPVIGDQAVDIAFGTGAVKVTPAHDFTDYEVGKRHHLPMIEVMDQHARMNQEAGSYSGLDRFACRKKIVADLEHEGLLVKVEDYRVRLSRGQRSGAVIEPRISLQWFCNMKTMGAAAADAVRKGDLKIVPERFERTWFQWMDNIRDWCVSRQLWWGHQIPVWYVVEPANTDANGEKPIMYCEVTGAAAHVRAIQDWGPDVQLRQDPDVLDTWFSSGLWPFSTLGWPDTGHADFKNWYPTTHLETGYDIIFFWVARMVMLGQELTGALPFHTVYLHGLIRTADGKKMSKSRPDNIIDPLELIESYGTDAVRFFLITAGAPGNDIKMDARKEGGKWRSGRIEGARNFANKLWNAARFVLAKVGAEAIAPLTSADPATEALADRWIPARLNEVIGESRRLMDAFQYGEAGRQICDFIWSDYCDWYLELSKLHLNPGVLVRTLESALRLLHPLMPYVTEELWQALKTGLAHVCPERFASPSLMLAEFPTQEEEAELAGINPKTAMLTVQDAVRTVREIRSDLNVAPSKKIQGVEFRPRSPDQLAVLIAQLPTISFLANIDPATARALGLGASGSLAGEPIAYTRGTVNVQIARGEVVDRAAEQARLATEVAALEAAITRGEALLTSDFGKRAPAAVIDKERAKLAENAAKLAQVRSALGAG